MELLFWIQLKSLKSTLLEVSFRPVVINTFITINSLSQVVQFQEKIPVEGANSSNVFTLRDFKDIANLKASVEKSKKLVVIGASFIGLETAASIKDFLKDKIDVTVVDSA